MREVSILKFFRWPITRRIDRRELKITTCKVCTLDHDKYDRTVLFSRFLYAQKRRVFETEEGQNLHRFSNEIFNGFNINCPSNGTSTLSRGNRNSSSFQYDPVCMFFPVYIIYIYIYSFSTWGNSIRSEHNLLRVRTHNVVDESFYWRNVLTLSIQNLDRVS